MLYDSEAQIDEHRARFEKELSELENDLSLTTPDRIKDALMALGDTTNFYFHYQGRNEHELQARVGALFHRVSAAAFPQYQEPPPSNPTRTRIRVGLISNTFCKHTLSKLFGGWIEHLNRKFIELYVFHTGSRVDAVTNRIQEHADFYVHMCGNNVPLIEVIRKASLDVLVFLDIGMDPRQQVLAALRLAPVQCTTWAHPVTSGIPNVDYFLSSDLMEPTNGADHYTERLIRLPNLGIIYQRPPAAYATTRIAGLAASQRPVFLCSQSLYKLLPQHDDLFVQIAIRCGPCSFWFIAALSDGLTRQFQRRLSRAFSAYGLVIDDYVRIFDRLTEDEFLALNRAADVVLDSNLWSGGNTSLEALACGRPIVSCPGPAMRGRHTYAILRMAGLDQLIAENLEQYVEIAARLGTDANWYRSVMQDVQTKSIRVFDPESGLRVETHPQSIYWLLSCQQMLFARQVQ